MSELLTTGQMIDKLKVGEIAEPMSRIKKNYVHRNDAGYYWGDQNKANLGDIFFVNNTTAYFEWRILPNYVSFDKAMKAYSEGETVCSHVEGIFGLADREFNIKEDSDMLLLNNSRITEGTWSIKGDQ